MDSFLDILHLVVPVDTDGDLAMTPLVINTARAALMRDPETALDKGLPGDIVCIWEVNPPLMKDPLQVNVPPTYDDVERACEFVSSREPDYVFGILDGHTVVEIDRETVAGFERRPVHT